MFFVPFHFHTEINLTTFVSLTLSRNGFCIWIHFFFLFFFFLPFLRSAVRRGWWGRPSPEWPGVVWVGGVGCWCQSPSESLCPTKLTWWLRSSRWHDRLPHTRLAYPPTAGESHQQSNSVIIIVSIKGQLAGQADADEVRTDRLLCDITVFFMVWDNGGLWNTSNQETTVGPSHWAKGSPLFLASSRSSCLQ